jgi:hypothetical protein
MAKTLDVFVRIRDRDPGFVVAMDLDEKKRIRALLFAHGSSRVNYSSFGDVVTFDTTYRTNLYNLPFGLFVGVNNHFQSIIFGGVLLTEETTDAFKWTFRNFVSIMGGRAPETILTGRFISFPNLACNCHFCSLVDVNYLYLMLPISSCPFQTSATRCV